jgi:hypothetical protein
VGTLCFGGGPFGSKEAALWKGRFSEELAFFCRLISSPGPERVPRSPAETVSHGEFFMGDPQTIVPPSPRPEAIPDIQYENRLSEMVLQNELQFQAICLHVDSEPHNEAPFRAICLHLEYQPQNAATFRAICSNELWIAECTIYLYKKINIH